MRKTLLDGPDWEHNSGTLLDHFCSVETKPIKKAGPKRLGAKRVKDMEKLQSPGETLKHEDATMFRVLAARANYLALDRPDVAYATTELCREFARPTAQAVQKLSQALVLRFPRRYKGCPENIHGASHLTSCYP